MKLMGSSYKNIAMEAFHVFKLFAIRENNPDPIVQILRKNSHTLVPFLRDLLGDIHDDEPQYEKGLLIEVLSTLTTKHSIP
jgi:calcium binding protein 39